jgi:UDP-N-acetyl-D-glucosamine dehydrogenase
MAAYTVQRIQAMLNARSVSLRGARILCLGAAFKRGVSDVRNSRAIHVMELLQQSGAIVSYCDPHVPSVRITGETLNGVSLESVESTDAQLVAVLVGGDWPLSQLSARGVPVFDAVNAGGFAAPSRERL